MKKIKVDPSGSGNLYQLSYRDTDAHRSQKLMARLVEMFVDSGTDSSAATRRTRVASSISRSKSYRRS